ncbi:hypothetical protein G3576_07225 [Roseomonas stagni]|uniref:Uncharacterized protein n=1 Tax=Falsiroseomonas algicola TaxID=2716930 RepID=A0A6M1LHS7_9PROT|nr:hypothetical protein [Falsiroseomonas algicola]NGM19801.1 hypothetical protein [Falsiroseomonas algicola]
MSRDQPRARRVYAWEDRVVAPLDRSRVPFAQMQALVDYVWAEAGLRWPPRVRRKRPSTRVIATGSRLAIEAPPELPSWVLLHEVAHAMTADHDGAGDGHGSAFMGIYVDLLVRHARLDRDHLAATLAAAGILWDPAAKPRFLDPSSPA